MIRLKLHFAAMVAALVFGLAVLGQAVSIAPGFAQGETPSGGGTRIDRLVEAISDKDGPQLAPDIVSPEYLDAETKAALQRSLTAYYDYRTSGFEHRRQVFAWQLLSSKIIFASVIALVAVGLYFSWLQFRVSLAGSGSAETTTIEASTSGLKVSSPILGVIILTLSLVFFYLYLIYVYPIVEIF